MNNYRLKINRSQIDSKDKYRILLHAVANAEHKEVLDIPEVIEQMWDLEEYVSEFLANVDCTMSVNVNFDICHDTVDFYIFKNGISKGSICMELTFDELRPYDIPHLGDAIFHIWNAYVDVFMGLHSTYIPPIPDNVAEKPPGVDE